MKRLILAFLIIFLILLTACSKEQEEDGLVEKVVENIKKGKFDKDLGKLKKMDMETIKKAYNERENEPDMADEFWEPEEKNHLVI